MPQIKKPTLIDFLLYHDPCQDGRVAAKVILDHFEVISSVGIGPGRGFDIGNKTGCTIVFVDTCPPLDNIIELAKGNKVIILDHHKGQTDVLYSKNLPKNVDFIFDLGRSGCQIAWDFSSNQKRPWIVDYVGDRDLWKFALPNSKYINLALNQNGVLQFSEIDKYMKMEEPSISLITTGKFLHEIQQKQIQEEVEKSELRTLNFWDQVFKVQLGTIKDPMLISDLGNALAKIKEVDFGAVWFDTGKVDHVQISLRGVEKSPDLSEIAKYFDGNGHEKASGFIIRVNTGETKEEAIKRVFHIIK
jgi:oligoribonuclease NrnB/cAMP/cGMP phosphodiesterase (DHH superfamily)